MIAPSTGLFSQQARHSAWRGWGAILEGVGAVQMYICLRLPPLDGYVAVCLVLNIAVNAKGHISFAGNDDHCFTNGNASDYSKLLFWTWDKNRSPLKKAKFDIFLIENKDLRNLERYCFLAWNNNRNYELFLGTILLKPTGFEPPSTEKDFFEWATPASFCLFSSFSNTNFTEKLVGFSRIQTRIVRVEGKHADHLTTITTLELRTFYHMIKGWNMTINRR